MYDVTGKSIRDIMNIAEGDFLSFSEKEQKLVTSRLVSAGNKRARRFIKITGQPINLKSYTSHGKFSVKGKTKKGGELYKEFKRVKEFLSRKTSSVRGYKAFIKKMSETPTYVGSRKEEIERPKGKYKDYDYDLETGEIIVPYRSQEGVPNYVGGRKGEFGDPKVRIVYDPETGEIIDTFTLESGDVWQATDDALEGSRYDFEKSVVYEIHDVVLDYMSEKRAKKYKDLTRVEKDELKKIIDSYIQGSGKNATFSGNM